MPISKQLALLYPDDWKAIADRIKERAHWRCERCGVAHGAYGYRDRRGDWHSVSGYGGLGCEPDYKVVRIVLTVHHVVALADGGSSDDGNLIALCCRCHNLADGPMRRRHAGETRAKRALAAKESAGQAALPCG